MDSTSEDEENLSLDNVFCSEETECSVSYSQRRKSNQANHYEHEELNKKRHHVGRSGNASARVKRVVSCKRKTHRVTVVRRKQLGCSRNFDAANKENATEAFTDTPQEAFYKDSLDFPLNFTNAYKSCAAGSAQLDSSTLSELSRDHSTMINVLFGRNLRLKVAFTLWQRNVGELLTYFLQIQDTGVIADFLPLISSCIDEHSPRISIGCCVDLFPLVSRVLCSPYEQYHLVCSKWICSVLKNWQEELQASGFTGSSNSLLDKNFQVFNRQLWELRYQTPFLKSASGVAGDIVKVVDCFLSQVQRHGS